MDKDYNTRLNWFKSRVGKRIFRDKTSCDCDTCKNVAKKGLIINDEMHAAYLNDCSFNMDIEYRDKL
jgi:hypothetical protein